MKVACLCGTYGRYSLVVESLACFLKQTAIDDASLIIFNQHPVPLKFDHPKVRVVNVQLPPIELRYIRRAMLDLVEPDVEFIHWWDDDDLYLPWHLEDALAHIGDAPAWRPERSWVSEKNTLFYPFRNVFEGAWIMRSDVIRAAPIDTHPNYLDHPVTLQIREADLLKTTELGDFMNYIYRWDTDTQHLSGFSQLAEPKLQVEFVTKWREWSQEVQRSGELVPADLTLRWQQFLDGITGQVSAENHAELRRRLFG